MNKENKQPDIEQEQALREFWEEYVEDERGH